MDGDFRTKMIKHASLVGIFVNGFLALIKIIVGFLVGSLVLISDGIDSASDVFISGVSLLATKFMNQPPDVEHPYGHGKAELIAGKVISLVIFSVAIQIALSAISDMRSGENTTLSFWALWAALVSICGKLGLWIYKYRLAKKTNSLLLMADAKNMRGDFVLSSVVLLALLVELIFTMPILDSLAALFVSIWMMIVSINLFREMSVELMDGHSDIKDYQLVINAVLGVKGVLHPHKIRLRKVGWGFYVDLDIEVDGHLTVMEGHRIAMEVETAIRASLENVYDVMVHVEPRGNCEEESFGLSEKEISVDINCGV